MNTRILYYWIFTLVWAVSMLLFAAYKIAIPYVEGSEDLLFGTIEFVTLAPLYGVAFLGNLVMRTAQTSKTSQFLLCGAIFFCCDLLRLHIKKYREYKRMAMRAKKDT
ncbi:MAG: hypothetical protein ABIG34_04745 [Candidatus Peregrinibacteria bacterium]